MDITGNCLKVTSIEALKEFSRGTIVELPEFSEGCKFFARLRRPSMLDMIKTGAISNSLIESANELFTKGSGAFSAAREMPTKEAVVEIIDVLEAICRASMVEPTYDELLENGIKMTDEQLLFVFAYCQNGVKELENFRS